MSKKKTLIWAGVYVAGETGHSGGQVAFRAEAAAAWGLWADGCLEEVGEEEPGGEVGHVPAVWGSTQLALLYEMKR